MAERHSGAVTPAIHTEIRQGDWGDRDLSGADLANVAFLDLDLADLTDADLRGSDLTALDPRAAQLRGATIDPAQAVIIAGALGLVVRPL
ncbi:pentapeptide repeat-containing protein [Rhizomonospora bruguierae]|uniref:pentapeptide repeat-containing protein n=1 Tax=Rhizomonospora bruguierae TaxID=1581705 RepID=UPI001BCC9AFD|nr:pentapeptide repeat-containing protein [Micromonospora sp. NBRC 107566]